ncbi:MAG: hypothetical protein NC343_05250 [Muribaculum sp.]|nr:hypothetical protein [Muribaculaceae bacterium]MCM1081137.1 hypothetical protein [Muribaculum sp.]
MKFIAFLMLGLAACMGFTACSDDDKDEPSSEQRLIGTWENRFFEEYDDEVEECVATLTFTKNGSGIISSEFMSYPEDNFSHPIKWSLSGDISDNAVLTIEGMNADSDEYLNQTFQATIVDKVLFLTDEEGETTRWEKKK